MPIQKSLVLSAIDAELSLMLNKQQNRPWYDDWKLWLGLGMWLSVWAKWLIQGYTGSFNWKLMYTCGLNLCILHAIQYNAQQGLLVVMIVLILQTLGTTFIWWKAPNVLKNGGFQASSVYQDLSLSIIQVVTVFIGQMFLVVFYLSSIFNTLQPDKMSFIFWGASFFCLQMAAFFNRGADSYIGTTWKTSEWCDIVKHANDTEFTCMGYKGEERRISVSRIDLFWRGIFGFIVNNVIRDILAFTIPILLGRFTDPLNFVVYCVGVNFIVTLDDMSPKHFGAHLLPGGDLSPRDETSKGSYAQMNNAIVAPV
jgi:hypothetical protein